MPSIPQATANRVALPDRSWIESCSTTVTSDQIWQVWTVSNATSSTTVSDPWPIWVRGSTNSATTTIVTSGTNAIVWDAWSRNWQRHIHAPPRQRTVEEIAQAEQRRIQAEGEKKEARERAARLLQEHLTPEQKAELADKGFFTLQSIDRNGRTRHYQIRKGYQRNVHEVDPATGRRLNTICAHPKVAVPDEDAMLIQKLMLESPVGHEEFLRIANISPYSSYG
jgi:hypothetical protein